MKLSKRLKAIADMIPQNVRVIDVGCDHALLDIYLTMQGKNHCIASDINRNVLVKTREMVHRYQLDDKIEILKSDGLKEIDLKKEDMVVIAGMGTTTILNILNAKKPNQMIIESHNKLEELRQEVSKLGFFIVKEQVVLEKNIYYVIMLFQKGIQKYNDKELFLGPKLMEQKDLISLSYFKNLLRKKEELKKRIPNKFSREKIEIEIEYLKEATK